MTGSGAPPFADIIAPCIRNRAAPAMRPAPRGFFGGIHDGHRGGESEGRRGEEHAVHQSSRLFRGAGRVGRTGRPGPAAVRACVARPAAGRLAGDRGVGARSGGAVEAAARAGICGDRYAGRPARHAAQRRAATGRQGDRAAAAVDVRYSRDPAVSGAPRHREGRAQGQRRGRDRRDAGRRAHTLVRPAAPVRRGARPAGARLRARHAELRADRRARPDAVGRREKPGREGSRAVAADRRMGRAPRAEVREDAKAS
ncbi:ATPase [Burkholderia cenocepacia PC184]|nr:ATPase [Burkholderia cenocepacia PC184]